MFSNPINGLYVVFSSIGDATLIAHRMPTIAAQTKFQGIPLLWSRFPSRESTAGAFSGPCMIFSRENRLD